jgi:hypothetical protein
MRHFRFGRPSPAMVVAVIALVGAFGGSALAGQAVDFAKSKLVSGKKIKKRSIAGNRLRRNTVTGTEVNEAKLGKVPRARRADSATSATSASTAARAGTAARADTAASATTAGNADTLDHLDSTDFQGQTQWALVNGSDSSIVAQSGGIDSASSGFTGRYFLDFGSDVSGTAILTSSSDKDVQFGGTLEASPCGTEAGDLECSVLTGAPPGVDSGGWVTVFSNNVDNTAGLDHSFYVAVLP